MEYMIFDWIKAAEVIRDLHPEKAEAGLEDCWFDTGGAIWCDNQIVPAENTYTFLASTWAKPMLDIDGDQVPCYLVLDDDEMNNFLANAKMYWPKEALEELNKIRT